MKNCNTCKFYEPSSYFSKRECRNCSPPHRNWKPKETEIATHQEYFQDKFIRPLAAQLPDLFRKHYSHPNCRSQIIPIREEPESLRFSIPGNDNCVFDRKTKKVFKMWSNWDAKELMKFLNKEEET